MMRIITVITVLLSVVFLGYSRIPQSAKPVAENGKYVIYVNEEKAPIDEFELPVTSVWVYNKESGASGKLFTTNKDYGPNSSDIKSFTPLPEVDITAVDTIQFFPYAENKMVVTGLYPSLTYNVTYIIDLSNGTAIGLPILGGVVGFTDEDGYAIGTTWDYLDEGGRYTILKIFDDNGKLRAKFSLKHK